MSNHTEKSKFLNFVSGGLKRLFCISTSTENNAAEQGEEKPTISRHDYDDIDVHTTSQDSYIFNRHNPRFRG